MMKTNLHRSLSSLTLTALLLGGSSAFAQVATASSATATLERETTVPAIATADYDTRQRVIDDVETKLRSAGEVVATLKRKVDAMESDAQKAFKEAHTTARQREALLRHTLKSVKDAKPENWTEVRSAVSARYTVYADALVQLDTAANPAATKQ